MASIRTFDKRDAASAAAAARIAGLVDAQLQRDDEASLVVSGGTTPVSCFGYLSAYSLNWANVMIALSDERWVPDNHNDSNEGLVRKSLLQDQASAANLISIYQDELTVDECCDSLQSRLPPSGFACAMVGMGADGHFASLFPDADSLRSGLDLNNGRFYLPVRTSASPHPRISMTLAALLNSDEILLLIFGEEKHGVYKRALAGDKSLPISALLAQQSTAVSVYWAP